jgi:hypothetical protein
VGNGRRVPGCHYDVFWLADLVCPPFERFGSLTGKHGLTDRTIEVLAAIPEAPNLLASLALRKALFGVTFLKWIGNVVCAYGE